jgi:hypothetical protein
MADIQDNELSGEAYRTLLSITLLAAELGEYDMGVDMAQNITDVSPDLPQAHAVVGMLHLYAGRADKTVSYMQDALTKFADFQVGKVILALGMMQSKQGGWLPMLESVIDDGRDETAIDMARALLGRNKPDADEHVMPVGLPANATWA